MPIPTQSKHIHVNFLFNVIPSTSLYKDYNTLLDDFTVVIVVIKQSPMVQFIVHCASETGVF
jgi:hypothetical protein